MPRGMPRAESTVDMTPAIELRAMRRAFGSVVALDSVSLAIAPGEFFALLGPSGSGKTTCLRLIAGFDQPDGGIILLDGEDVTNTPPFARNVNTVFQDYALFPHMTVAENVAYGLRVRGVAAAERAQQAAAMLDLVRLGEFGARRPHQLSGGQRQRVALARALINRPKVLLLDEPLGALDLKLREEMQVELKGLQQRLGITFVFVTHDQGEALSMADRVAVFSQGRIEQLDTPRELYNRPQTAFVASFVGSANVVGREAAQVLTGHDRAFAIRPELIDLLAAGEPAADGHVQCAGEIVDVLYHGASSRLRVKVNERTTLAVARSESAGGVQGLATGARVRIAWRPDHAVPLRD
jgi:putative spermidine/putrescine transport system ATP-binding protein